MTKMSELEWTPLLSGKKWDREEVDIAAAQRERE